MKTMEQKNDDMDVGMNKGTHKNHTCPTGHCCDCSGCNYGCGGMHGGMRRYWRRHFLALVLGVIAAFCVGLKLGEIKGYLMANYGGMPMSHHGWMMDREGYGTDTTTSVAPTYPTAPVTAPQQ